MTWISTWQARSDRARFATHETEKQAEAHAAEMVASKQASAATVFWSEEGPT